MDPSSSRYESDDIHVSCDVYGPPDMTQVLKKPYVLASIAVLVVVGYVLATNSDAILAGHRSYLWLYLGAAAAAIIGLAVGTVRRTISGRLWLGILASIPLLALAVAAWLLSPFAATDIALDALADSDSVVVSSSASAITIEPTTGARDVGLIFQPGARVDARAYAHILRPLAEAGYRVVIVKQPLGIAFLASGFAEEWASTHPETETWAVGGHSLGGVVASSNAADNADIDGLVLWASVPASDISDSTRLDVASIYGTNDDLTDPDQVRESSANLPMGTRFVPIEGGTHAFFGDYGIQPGDGEPGVPRDQAQAEIASSTIGFLGGLLAAQ